MPSISGSSALLVQDRVWPQHQAALTLIKDRVENPSLSSFRWLDLACGRGQILSNVDHIITKDSSRKIEYTGIDVVKEYCLQTEQIAKQLFGLVQVHVCEVDEFEKYLEPEERFDAVTLTNTVHEITPEQLASTFVSALCRVTDDGFMFMYDMETLPDPELGAIPWLGTDMEQIFHHLLGAAGEAKYLPAVATWPHKSCKGWQVHVNRNHLSIPVAEMESRRTPMMAAALDAIRQILEKRLLDINAALSAACRYGTGSPEEQLKVQRLAYDYWAVSRALGGPLALFSSSEI